MGESRKDIPVHQAQHHAGTQLRGGPAIPHVPRRDSLREFVSVLNFSVCGTGDGLVEGFKKENCRE
jgi:hypothetical protein